MKRMKWPTGVSGIYQIKSLVDGKCYIGSAVNVEGRLRDHLFYLRGNNHRHNRHLQGAFNLYGEDNFMFESIFYCHKKDLLKFEQQEIDKHSFENELYNLCPVAGSRLGVKFSEEHRQRISKANRGKEISEEAKQNMSKAHKDKRLSEEHKQSMSEGLKGKKLSEEHKQKISKAQKGRKHTEKAKQKMSEAHKGQRAWNKGMKMNQERIRRE